MELLSLMNPPNLHRDLPERCFGYAGLEVDLQSLKDALEDGIKTSKELNINFNLKAVRVYKNGNLHPDNFKGVHFYTTSWNLYDCSPYVFIGTIIKGKFEFVDRFTDHKTFAEILANS